MKKSQLAYLFKARQYCPHCKHPASIHGLTDTPGYRPCVNCDCTKDPYGDGAAYAHREPGPADCKHMGGTAECEHDSNVTNWTKLVHRGHDRVDRISYLRDKYHGSAQKVMDKAHSSDQPCPECNAGKMIPCGGCGSHHPMPAGKSNKGNEGWFYASCPEELRAKMEAAKEAARPAPLTTNEKIDRLSEMRSKYRGTGQSALDKAFQGWCAAQCVWRFPDELEKAETTEDPNLREVAGKYMKTMNRTAVPIGDRKVDRARAAQIATEYHRAPKMGRGSAARLSYRAFANEVHMQHNHLREHGYKMEPWTGEGQPYKDSSEMHADVRNNKHLHYFTGGEKHPLMDENTNNKFRAIHDIFGHAMGGHSFGPNGEERAWAEHSQMFSPTARGAMTTETRGQNSWTNYGPHGEHNRTNPANTIYPPQKGILLPRKFWKAEAKKQKPIKVNTLYRSHVITADGKMPQKITDSPDMSEKKMKERFGLTDPHSYGPIEHNPKGGPIGRRPDNAGLITHHGHLITDQRDGRWHDGMLQTAGVQMGGNYYQTHAVRNSKWIKVHHWTGNKGKELSVDVAHGHSSSAVGTLRNVLHAKHPKTATYWACDEPKCGASGESKASLMGHLHATSAAPIAETKEDMVPNYRNLFNQSASRRGSRSDYHPNNCTYCSRPAEFQHDNEACGRERRVGSYAQCHKNGTQACARHQSLLGPVKKFTPLRKSQEVYDTSAKGVKFTHSKRIREDGKGGRSTTHTTIMRERPDRPNKTLTLFSAGRTPMISHWKTGDQSVDKHLPAEEWAKRENNKGTNVRIRSGIIMDPTESTRNRYKQFAGRIKQQHNERLVREKQRAGK